MGYHPGSPGIHHTHSMHMITDNQSLNVCWESLMYMYSQTYANNHLWIKTTWE